VNRRTVFVGVALVSLNLSAAQPARGYTADFTLPGGGGCPVENRANISTTAPLNRRWSTSLPSLGILTVAANGTGAQTAEIQQAIEDSFGAWSGVTGTMMNAVTFPAAIGPLTQVATANSCTDDQQDDVDGLNMVCFNQTSAAFATGVLSFTRVITVNAPGEVVGAAAPAEFAGQIVDSDTLLRNDGQVTFATPAALATTGGAGAYDLESILIHELGEWFGLDSSAVWRSAMFPFAPSPGQFLGARPTAQAPDGPLSDDDRTGLRSLYPDPNDAVNVGEIRGRIVPANPLALATIPPPAPGSFVTGIFGAHVVAVDADSGSVISAGVSGLSCDPGTGLVNYDGTYDIQRLPVGHSYMVYAEPLVGLATPEDFTGVFAGVCGSLSDCTAPALNINFNPTFLSGP
jgi:hypothetical protein